MGWLQGSNYRTLQYQRLRKHRRYCQSLIARTLSAMYGQVMLKTIRKPKSKQDFALVLGVESSCDETAASVLRRAQDGQVEVLSSIVASQDEIHTPYGGVVPELAARAHMQKIESVMVRAVEQAGINWTQLHAVAATSGPGLIGGVITGLMAAKGLSVSLDIPLIAVNHLEGHAVSPRLTDDCPFPYLLLLVSGGHTQLLGVKGVGDFTRLGSTRDDAAGETFDKTAKIMGLGFPGGPAVEKMAANGDPNSVKLPRPFLGKPHADFSFSGLKTATLRAYENLINAKLGQASERDKANLAASFQQAVCDILCDRTRTAMDMFKRANNRAEQNGPYRFVVAGGVAANARIRTALDKLCTDNNFTLFAPPLKYCGDNGAMIALAGAERLALGITSDLDVCARPRWPLDQDSADNNPASGFGKKGPKS